MSPSDFPSAASTIPGLSGTGTQVARLMIEIVRSVPIAKVLTPALGTPLEISFTHPKSVPTHARPHGIEWVATNLLPGERIEVRLDTSFPGYVQSPLPFHLKPWWEHLQKIFPTADVVPSGAFGWELTHDSPSAVSGHAATTDRFQLKPDAKTGRPLLHYHIVFYDVNNVEHALDPDVDVNPDP